jgi:hypothetical protein
MVQDEVTKFHQEVVRMCAWHQELHNKGVRIEYQVAVDHMAGTVKLGDFKAWVELKTLVPDNPSKAKAN